MIRRKFARCEGRAAISVLPARLRVSTPASLESAYAYYRSMDESIYIRPTWCDSDLVLDSMDNEEVERDSDERSDDQLGVYGIDEITSDSDRNRTMDVVDVEENVNEVSMDEVSVGCDPEYEDYGTVGTNNADKAENADYIEVDSAEERLLGEIASENAIDVPERHEPVMVAVADLLVGDDVDVNYAGSGEYFPGRLLELDVTGEIPVATVKLHTRHVCERVPISLLRSRT